MKKFFSRLLLSPGPDYSIWQSICYIILSCIIIIPPLGWLGLPYFPAISQKKSIPIKNLYLIHSPSDKIPGAFFSEILQIYADETTLLSDFSIKQAEKTLLKTLIFDNVTIEKIPDSKGISITYYLKKPIAYLGHPINAFINTKGDIFPEKPFFNSKNIPIVFVNPEHTLNENKILSINYIQLIIYLIKELSEDIPTSIDLTKLYDYPGEIYISLTSGNILRLPFKDLHEAFNLYRSTRATLDKGDNNFYIYDLRFPSFTLIKNITSL